MSNRGNHADRRLDISLAEFEGSSKIFRKLKKKVDGHRRHQRQLRLQRPERLRGRPRDSGEPQQDPDGIISPHQDQIKN